MKNFLTSLGKFLLTACLIYSILIILAGNYLPKAFHPNLFYPDAKYGLTKRQFSEVDSVENIDILFLGNSHARRGFDPRVFKESGFSSFNFGSPAQTPMQAELLLNRYFQQLKPKLIIYEVSPLSFLPGGVESAHTLIASDEVDLNNIIMAIRMNHLKVYNATIFGFYSKLDFNLKPSSILYNNKNDKYILGGFAVREVSPLKSKNIAKQNSVIEINDKQLKAFNRIIQGIKGSDSKLLLVQAPVTKGFYSSYSNNEYFDSVMQSYGKYINYNKVINLEDTIHFYDHHHLLPSGAKVFNNKLVELIKKEILLSI